MSSKKMAKSKWSADPDQDFNSFTVPKWQDGRK